MKPISKLLLAVTLFCVGCSDEGNIIVDQQTAFEKYLEGEDAQYRVRSGVYKYTPNADREGGDQPPVIEYGDSVKFDYALMRFSSKPDGLIFTNMPALVKGDTVLNPKYWSFAPLGIKLGTTPLVKGLEYGILDSHEGDSVLLLLTSDLAYGDKPLGVIPADTPMAWSLKINKIVKKVK